MKKYLMLSLCFLIFIPNLISQECKYRRNATDEFTGDKIKETSWQTILNHSGLMQTLALHLSVCNINDNEYVEIHYQLKKEKKASLTLNRKVSKLMFKLANDEIVALDYGESDFFTYSKNEYKYSSSSKSSKWEHNLKCKFILTPEQKEKLNGQKITKIRLVLKDSNLEYDINPKVKGGLLGYSNKGIKPKRFDAQGYFGIAFACL